MGALKTKRIWKHINSNSFLPNASEKLFANQCQSIRDVKLHGFKKVQSPVCVDNYETTAHNAHVMFYVDIW